MFYLPVRLAVNDEAGFTRPNGTFRHKSDIWTEENFIAKKFYRFFVEEGGLPMGSPLWPAVANICMEWFVEKHCGSAGSNSDLPKLSELCQIHPIYYRLYAKFNRLVIVWNIPFYIIIVKRTCSYKGIVKLRHDKKLHR